MRCTHAYIKPRDHCMHARLCDARAARARACARVCACGQEVQRARFKGVRAAAAWRGACGKRAGLWLSSWVDAVMRAVVFLIFFYGWFTWGVVIPRIQGVNSVTADNFTNFYFYFTNYYFFIRILCVIPMYYSSTELAILPWFLMFSLYSLRNARWKFFFRHNTALAMCDMIARLRGRIRIFF